MSLVALMRHGTDYRTLLKQRDPENFTEWWHQYAFKTSLHPRGYEEAADAATYISQFMTPRNVLHSPRSRTENSALSFQRAFPVQYQDLSFFVESPFLDEFSARKHKRSQADQKLSEDAFREKYFQGFMDLVYSCFARDVVMVTHDKTMNALLPFMMDSPPEDIGNASVIIFEYDDTGPLQRDDPKNFWRVAQPYRSIEEIREFNSESRVDFCR